MLWAVLGVLHSMFRAVGVEIARENDLGIRRPALGESVWAVLMLLPLLPFMIWPQTPDFYLAAVFLAIVLSANILLRAKMEHAGRGRINAAAMPVEAFAAFVLWTFVSPGTQNLYSASPLAAGIVIVAFFIMAAGLWHVRPHDVSFASFIRIVPMGLSMVTAGIVAKLAIPFETAVSSTLAFVLVASIVNALIIGMALILKWRAPDHEDAPPLFHPTRLKVGFINGAFGLAASLALVSGIVFAPNPAYIAAMTALTPVWVLWWREIRNRDDKSNPRAAALIILGTLLLIGVEMVF